jgi:hypothetical protein
MSDIFTVIINDVIKVKYNIGLNKKSKTWNNKAKPKQKISFVYSSQNKKCKLIFRKM